MKITADALTSTQASGLMNAGYAESINAYGPEDNQMFRVTSRELSWTEADDFLGLIEPLIQSQPEEPQP